MPTKEPKLSQKEEKRIAQALERAKEDIIEERENQDEADHYYATEGLKRYECIVKSSRKGEKQFELSVPNPANPARAVILKGYCGVRIKDGLPMTAIDALESAYDYETEEKPTSQDPNVYQDTTFIPGERARYSVKIIGEVKKMLKMKDIL